MECAVFSYVLYDRAVKIAPNRKEISRGGRISEFENIGVLTLDKNMITRHATNEISTYSFTDETVSCEDGIMISFRRNRNKLWHESMSMNCLIAFGGLWQGIHR
jgi:hypothetical protein